MPAEKGFPLDAIALLIGKRMVLIHRFPIYLVKRHVHDRQIVVRKPLGHVIDLHYCSASADSTVMVLCFLRESERLPSALTQFDFEKRKK